MHFNIALTMDTRAGGKSHILTNLSTYMKAFFKDRDYGADLLNYTLGFTSVLAPEGFGHFFEKKKPLYVSDRTTKNSFLNASTLARNVGLELEAPMQPIIIYGYIVRNSSKTVVGLTPFKTR